MAASGLPKAIARRGWLALAAAVGAALLLGVGFAVRGLGSHVTTDDAFVEGLGGGE